MLLVDLRNCEGVDDVNQSSAHSHTRVILSNLLRGLEQGHVKSASAHNVFVELIDQIEKSGGPKAVHVDQLYGFLVEVLVKWGPDLFFERSELLVSHAEVQAATYQPSWAFKYWLNDDVSEARKPVHNQADVAVLVREFDAVTRRQPGARVGREKDVVWLTPLFGHVHDALDRASRIQRAEGDDALDRAGIADELRNLLGLQSRVFPERAVALVIDHTIDQLQTGAMEEVERDKKSGKDRRRALAAPTQFDARNFPRFRHWPTKSGEHDSDYGRTWPLDGKAGSSGGVPEFVGNPLDMNLVTRIVSLGRVEAVQLKEAEAIVADKDFADRICGGATLTSLLQGMGAKLRL